MRHFTMAADEGSVQPRNRAPGSTDSIHRHVVQGPAEAAEGVEAEQASGADLHERLGCAAARAVAGQRLGSRFHLLSE